MCSHRKKKKKPCWGYRGKAAINAPRRQGLGRIQTCRRFIWTYSLQNPEKINSCCFRHPACNTALRQPRQHKTPPPEGEHQGSRRAPERRDWLRCKGGPCEQKRSFRKANLQVRINLACEPRFKTVSSTELKLTYLLVEHELWYMSKRRKAIKNAGIIKHQKKEMRISAMWRGNSF